METEAARTYDIEALKSLVIEAVNDPISPERLRMSTEAWIAKRIQDAGFHRDATQPEQPLEYGYSHGGNNRGDGYEPILYDGASSRWYATIEEALEAKRRDLRWCPETFIICRPKPQPGRRFEVPAN